MAASPSNIRVPDLALPKGGGAIRGLEPSVASAGFRGMAQLAIALPQPEARALTPSLSFAYSSGGGNGPYGVGASIALPTISRSTAGGVPIYTGADTIVFSETGPLIAKGVWQNGRWVPSERTVTDSQGVVWQVQVFVPRAESTLPLIEQWTRLDDRTSYWRVVGADNVVSRFGVSAGARISNPRDATQILEWLIEDVADAKGNIAQYVYKPEDNTNTGGTGPQPNKYIERIRYGNYGAPDSGDFAFEIVFDYGEYGLDNLDQPNANPYQPIQAWPVRLDPFSSYRGGFELRTNRLCFGVLTFHRFPNELGDTPCLTGAMRFGYAQSPYMSCLTSLTRVGYRRQQDGSYTSAAMPPVALTYSGFDPPPAPPFRHLRVEDAANLPGYLVPGAYQPVDLDGEGLPGFLQSDDVTTSYYAPLGGGRYAAPSAPAAFPDCNLANPQMALVDLNADGRLELLVNGDTGSGYFRHFDNGGWSGFEPLERLPTVQQAPSMELVDLTGDGVTDLMQVSGAEVKYYLGRGTHGFEAQRSALRQPDFPSADANSGREFVTFANMFGDGLAHRVRVTDGEVAVWPNLGHGRFGTKVRLANAPQFGPLVSSSQLHFADVDGSGAADLVVAHSDRLLIYRNQSGNGFAAPLTVPLPFRLADNDQLSFADILGNGTTAIVATRIAPSVEHWFCDLASPTGEPGRKPYLLNQSDNGGGASTTIDYTSSTTFYLADKRAGRPWVTRLPFPLQVVERIVTTDGVTGAQAEQRFAYHDGYFDSESITFRGFGFIESWQTQSFTPFQPSTSNPDWPVTRVNADLKVAPIYTKTWYCTGAYFQSGAIAAQYAGEYFAGDPKAAQLPASVFDPAVLAAGGTTLLQAYAVLSGKMLHAEVYMDDGGPRAGIPYTVTEANYAVALVQAAGPQGYASLLARDHEQLLYTYERDASDPRLQHSFLLASTLLDPTPANTFYERRCTVYYGRRQAAPAVYPEQYIIKAGVEEAWSTRVLEPFRLIGVGYEQRASDVNGLTPPAAGIYTFAEIEQQVATALQATIPYGQPFTPGVLQARLATDSQSYFWNDAQTAALPLGQIAARALLHHQQNAAFSQTWRTAIYGDKVSDADLTGVAGLVSDQNGYWWNPGLIQNYFTPDQPDLFFLQSGTASPVTTAGLYQKSSTLYDTPYALMPVSTSQFVDDATALTTVAQIDYQALQPSQVVDPNGIVQQALYDPLGFILVNSVFKPAAGSVQRVGDGDLSNYIVRTDASFASVLADPAYYLQDAGTFFYYDLLAWASGGGQPMSSITLTRTRFVSDNVANAPIEIAIAYSDGAGLAVENKKACEPAPSQSGTRWLASDRTVYDGQGQPTQVFLPFYTGAPGYEVQQTIVDDALAPAPRISGYDPLQRVIKVDTPQGFFTRTEFAAWQTAQYDEDDTILDAPYYIDFMAHYPANPDQRQQDEKAALDKAAKFYNTPTTTVLDNAAHTIRQIQNNLGNVPSDAFVAIVAGSGVTSAALWSALIDAGYLATTTTPAGTWVTAKFQPYMPGFVLTLPAPYDQFAAAVTTALTQNDLTNFFAVDLAGRTLTAIDPRLYLADVQQSGTAANFQYAYAMGADETARTDSADAGTRWILPSFLGSPVLGFDAMGRRQQKTFDGLQRLTTTVIVEASASRTAEVLTYGESQANAASANLLGQLYQLEDEAGVAIYPSYTILGQPTASSRQFAQDYKAPIDWSTTVALDPTIYNQAFTYDALRRNLTETMPDGSAVAWQYYVSGRLQSIDVTFSGGAAQPFVTAIDYNADDTRAQIAYGNAVAQTLAYETTTGRLITLAATRPSIGPQGPQDPLLQTVDYTYDPVGNVSVVRDRTAQLLFCGGTEPVAIGDYGYDALYRATSATGLQHPDIEADTHVTGFMQSLYAELCPPGTPPIVLENYAETYTYDNSSNLTAMQHSATSASFERDNPVVATSNRLAGVPYDANGNTQSVTLTSAVPLLWGARNEMVESGPLQKPDGSYDHDYLVYDFFSQRVRRIVETSATATGPVTTTREQITVGSYVATRTTTDTTTVSTTLKVMDGDSCLVVTNAPSTGSPEIRYQLGDRLGSVSIEVGADTGILSYEAFFPFGGTAIIAGSDPAVVDKKLLRYSGKQCDDSTGFYYYGARYFLPWQARWLNPDPSGAADGMNLMQFVGANPLTRIDTDGRGKDDPQEAAKQSVIQSKALQSFLSSFMYSVFSAPETAYRYAPVAISKYLSFDPAVRQQQREAFAARQEERSLILRTIRGLPADHPLSKAARQMVTDPSFLAGLGGSIAGSAFTVGTSLAIGHRLLLSGAPLPVKLIASPFVIGQMLGAFGRGEVMERGYKAHQEYLNQLPAGQRTYKDRMPEISGIPRYYLFVENNRRQAQKLKEQISPEFALAAFTLLAAGYLFGPKAAEKMWRGATQRGGGSGGSGGSSSTALMLRPSNPPAIKFKSPTALVPVKPSGPPATIVEQPGALTLYKAPINSITVYKKPPTAPTRYQPPVTALTTYRAPTTALTTVVKSGASNAMRSLPPVAKLTTAAFVGGALLLNRQLRQDKSDPH
jgi:RHS repeat-associated protein